MNNVNLVVMTAAKAKPGKQAKVFQALCDVAEAARAQSGCVDYRILCSPEDATTTINLEIWSSQAERNLFNDGLDVQKFGAAVSGNFAEPPQPILYQVVG